MVVGNGEATSFWFDIWTPYGQLINFIGSGGPRALRLRKKAMVSEAINDSAWALPHPRSDQEVAMHTYLTTFSLPLPPDVVDIYEWKTADYPLNVFNSQATWEVLHPRQATQDWHDIVWFKGAVPKHAFTMWIANYDRLPTRSRLASWDLAIPVICPFYGSQSETRDHLFFSCPYAIEVWSFIFLTCRPPNQRIVEWSELLFWIRASNSIRKRMLRKLASQTVVFHLWKQRNNIIHNFVSCSEPLTGK